ncbi:MAG: hypothetical protein M3442_03865 [Chloroflexota bacterium]|nr:hypothetical protein [Chloroflexota bacterium]
MTKWEYARLESTERGVSVVFTHREPWAGLASSAFFETLGRLGDEGWEVVSALPLAAAADFESQGSSGQPPTPQKMRLRLETDRWLLFKRPQPAEPESRSSHPDLVKNLVERQLLKGKLPF